GKTIGHAVSFPMTGEKHARRRHHRGSGDPRQDGLERHQLFGRFMLRLVARVKQTPLRLCYAKSFLFFAARSDAAVSPPPTLVRFNDSRMPWVGIGARFELSVRELTPIHEISEDSRPYSILGHRFITTVSPAASAFAAAAS